MQLPISIFRRDTGSSFRPPWECDPIDGLESSTLKSNMTNFSPFKMVQIHFFGVEFWGIDSRLTESTERNLDRFKSGVCEY